MHQPRNTITERLRAWGPGNPCSAEIVDLERMVNARIPEDCRSGLEAGGLMPADLVAYYDLTEAAMVDLGWLMNIEEAMSARDATEGAIERHLVPFGQDGGDNLLCVSIRGPCVGRIYFHLHGIASLDPDNETEAPTSAHLVADSYEAFLESFQRSSSPQR